MKDWRKRFRSFWTAINKDYELNFETGDDRRVSGEVEDFIFSVLTTQIDKKQIDEIVEAQVKKALASQLKEVRSRIEALQQEFVGKMAIDALIKLSLELEAELSQLAEGEK